VHGGGGFDEQSGLRVIRRADLGAVALRPGQVVVLDNLGAHRGERVRDLVEARGCSLLFLLAYSPDFSAIEEAFSKIKALLRKAKARTREAPRRSWRPSAGS
jgi:transposase